MTFTIDFNDVNCQWSILGSERFRTGHVRKLENQISLIN